MERTKQVACDHSSLSASWVWIKCCQLIHFCCHDFRTMTDWTLKLRTKINPSLLLDVVLVKCFMTATRTITNTVAQVTAMAYWWTTLPGTGLGQVGKTQEGSEVKLCGDAVCSCWFMTRVVGEENIFPRNCDMSQENYYSVKKFNKVVRIHLP